MRNKALLIAVGLVLLLSVLVFFAGWKFGSHSRPAATSGAAAGPLGAPVLLPQPG